MTFHGVEFCKNRSIHLVWKKTSKCHAVDKKDNLLTSKTSRIDTSRFLLIPFVMNFQREMSELVPQRSLEVSSDRFSAVWKKHLNSPHILWSLLLNLHFFPFFTWKIRSSVVVSGLHNFSLPHWVYTNTLPAKQIEWQEVKK